MEGWALWRRGSNLQGITSFVLQCYMTCLGLTKLNVKGEALSWWTIHHMRKCGCLEEEDQVLKGFTLLVLWGAHHMPPFNETKRQWRNPYMDEPSTMHGNVGVSKMRIDLKRNCLIFSSKTHHMPPLDETERQGRMPLHGWIIHHVWKHERLEEAYITYLFLTKLNVK